MVRRKRRSWLKSPIKQKVLLLLATGVALGLTRSPRQYYRILKSVPQEWRAIDRKYLVRLVREFKSNRLINYREDNQGVVSLVLTEKGRRLALRYNPDHLAIKTPENWDKKWRLVMFDIPENKRGARDALRLKLKELGFKELQHSVFVYPYECANEINFVVEFFEVRPHVHLATVESLTNEADLLLKFDLQKKI